MSDQTPPRPARIKVPFFLLCGAGFLAFFATVDSFVVVSIALVAGIGTGPYAINGHPATKAQFWAFAWPLLLTFAVLALVAGAFSFVVWKERPWSRTLAMCLWFALMLTASASQLYAPQPTADWIIGLVTTACCWTFALWYFYGKNNVVEYYDRLRERVRAA